MSNYITTGACCSSCSRGGPCASSGLPSVPEASTTNLILAGFGVAFAYLVLRPKRRKKAR